MAPHAVRNLVLLYMPTQLTLYFIAVFLVSRYRIDRKTHEDNLARLAQAAALAEVAPIAAIAPGGSEDPSGVTIAAAGG